ncbi:MAG: hypothetical protein E7091_07415 [Bacteroidales bacterium]|nr:hypothetical protein [Bacteroidales bacterium]
MKKYLWMTVFTVLMCVGFTACSEEDKEPTNPLVGMWETDRKTGNIYIDDVYIYTFKSDGTYTWNVGVYWNGGGYYSYEDSYLTLSEAGGSTSVWAIMALEKKYFVVVTQSGSTYTFYKSDEDGAKAEKMDVSGTVQNHEYVDLGLSVKWATCNVGASLPEEEGDYYAWGETSTKKDYSWNTYKWSKNGDSEFTKYCSQSIYGYNGGFADNLTTLEPTDDVATAKWGNKWRMPTMEEMKELCERCTWDWVKRNGYYGWKMTGPNGKSIFLPLAGYRYGTEVYGRGEEGCYWSGELFGYQNSGAYYLYFGRGYFDWDNCHSRCHGLTVRPVTE